MEVLVWVLVPNKMSLIGQSDQQVHGRKAPCKSLSRWALFTSVVRATAARRRCERAHTFWRSQHFGRPKFVSRRRRPMTSSARNRLGAPVLQGPDSFLVLTGSSPCSSAPFLSNKDKHWCWLAVHLTFGLALGFLGPGSCKERAIKSERERESTDIGIWL